MPTLSYGILSDTHGFLPAGVYTALEGVTRIFHCGDIGSPGILQELLLIAPVTAVAGNMDPWPLSGSLPETVVDRTPFGTLAMAHAAGHSHDNEQIAQALLRRFRADDPRVILFGHSHEPYNETLAGTLLLNPGSASRPAHGLAATVAILEYDQPTDRLEARFVPL